MATIEERVKRGAKWLDKVRPNWFYTVIDDSNNPLDTRAMESCGNCVAGRIFDSYSNLPIPREEGDNFDEVASDYGFTCDWRQMPDYDYRNYVESSRRRTRAASEEFIELARLWNIEVNLRLQKEAADGDPRRS